MASKTTTDHDFIRRWVEERRGHPACVKGAGGKDDAGILRIDFPGCSGEESLQPISWEEFFEKFEESKLALLYEEGERDGGRSRFNKLINRETAESGRPT
jgi:hypothetical protein